jgi:large subunit ribosomal protein L5e
MSRSTWRVWRRKTMSGTWDACFFPINYNYSVFTNWSHSFKKQFASYLADDIGSEDIEEIYTNAYAAIREDPTFKPTEKTKDWKAESAKHRTPKLTYEQRKERIQAKIDAFQASGGAAAEEEEDEDEE